MGVTGRSRDSVAGLLYIINDFHLFALFCFDTEPATLSALVVRLPTDSFLVRFRAWHNAARASGPYMVVEIGLPPTPSAQRWSCKPVALHA